MNGESVTAPADREWWQWATRVEEEYRKRFGEPVQTECTLRPPRPWRPQRRPWTVGSRSATRRRAWAEVVDSFAPSMCVDRDDS